MNNFFIIVLDGVGVGELPDADLYGDTGSNTLGNIANSINGLTPAEFSEAWIRKYNTD